MRALILDDDPTIVHLLKYLLNERGHETLTYTSPETCPAYTSASCPCPFAEACPDLILTDINMPAVSGVRFVENLKSKGCTCPNIAIISGNWTDSDLKRANRMDVSVFSKPLCPAHIRSWLDKIEQKAQESGERESRNPDREGYRPN
jgi:CheY-like chemotaxis protein